MLLGEVRCFHVAAVGERQRSLLPGDTPGAGVLRRLRQVHDAVRFHRAPGPGGGDGDGAGSCFGGADVNTILLWLDACKFLTRQENKDEAAQAVFHNVK